MTLPTSNPFARTAAGLMNRVRAERSLAERERLLIELRDLRSRNLDVLSAIDATGTAPLASIADSVRDVSGLVDWTHDPTLPR